MFNPCDYYGSLGEHQDCKVALAQQQWEKLETIANKAQSGDATAQKVLP